MNMPLLRDTAVADAKTHAVLPYITELGAMGATALPFLKRIANLADSQIQHIENRQIDERKEG